MFDMAASGPMDLEYTMTQTSIDQGQQNLDTILATFDELPHPPPIPLGPVQNTALQATQVDLGISGLHMQGNVGQFWQPTMAN
jgi:hypothetical protein